MARIKVHTDREDAVDPFDLPTEQFEQVLKALGEAVRHTGTTVPSEHLATLVSDSVRTTRRLRGVSQRLHMPTADAVRLLEQIAMAAPAGAQEPTSTLTVDQERVLRAAGSLREAMPPLEDRTSTMTAVEGAQMIADAISVKDVARLLKVSEGRVRQRIAARTLLALEAPGGWRLPGFQFTDTGALRGLDRVLPAFPRDVHPLVVATFLRRPHPDLALDGQSLSPRDWLTDGGDIEVVMRLAAASHDLP